LAGSGLAWLAASQRRSSAAAYRVGLGHLADPYAATHRAVEASGEWPATEIAGKKVIIKPNLVVPMTADTGVTTGPQVVRALVDLALSAGAAQVIIVEGEFNGPNFSACGYDFLDTYDPGGRVSLVDLSQEPAILAQVPSGMAYGWIHMPELLLEDDVFFISAAKLKTHFHTHATLTMKNSMGVPPVDRYRVPPEEWRYAMHRRGTEQAIVDLNLVRPIDFAVVDGVWGMEGEGPVQGTAVELDLVVAGRNAVAVDHACLWATGLPHSGVQHLKYAADKALGPSGMEEIDLLGDAFAPRAFASPPSLLPVVEYPRAVPHRFAPGVGQQTSVTYWVVAPCETRVEIVRTSEVSPEVAAVRILHDWTSRPAGSETLTWDGRDDAGQVVPPGRYTAQVAARYSDDPGEVSYATGWVWVAEHTVYLPMVFRATG